MRVTNAGEDFWLPLEEVLRGNFLPKLTGRPAFSNTERELLSLPPRLGGIGVTNPMRAKIVQIEASRKVTEPLVASLLKEMEEPVEVLTHETQIGMKAEVHHLNNQRTASYANDIKASLPNALQVAIQHCCEDGASSWLTAVPIKDYGFNLHKQAFRDALSLLLYATAGQSTVFHHMVPVEPPSALITLLVARRVDFPRYGTTKLEMF